jgi:hypothetical protein
MHECPVDHPALLTLFDPMVPNSPVLWSVLEGRNPGRALVDSVPEPSQCVIRTDRFLRLNPRSASLVNPPWVWLYSQLTESCKSRA